MRRKFLMLSILFGVGILAISPLIYYNVDKPKATIKKSYWTKNITFKGALKNSQTIEINSDDTNESIKDKLNLLFNADYEKLINVKDKSVSKTYFVYFKKSNEPYLQWSNITSIDVLKATKLSDSIAKILWDYRSKNERSSWEQLSSLKGIGSKTLEKIKKIIIL